MLQLDDLSKTYQNNRVLESLTYRFQDPGIYTISGRNGIGKSTMFRLIAGAEIATSGHITLNGLCPLKNHVAYRQRLSWAPEMDGVFPFLTPLEYLRLILHLRQLPDTLWPQGLIDQLALTPFLNTRFEELSLGNKKKTLLIGALMIPFQVLLLDEACAGFDHNSQLEFKNILRPLGRNAIVLLVNHDAEQLGDVALTALELVHEQQSQLRRGGA